MNEELLTQLADAMKRREKAQNGKARWEEQLNDANEDIAELSSRIAGGLEPEEDEDDEDEAPQPAPLYYNSDGVYTTQAPTTGE